MGTPTGDKVRERIVGAVAAMESLPMLDGTVQRMQALLDDPDSSSAAVAVIAQDADFAAHLLRLANSAYFGEERLDALAHAHPAGGVERAIAEREQFGIDHAHAGALYAYDCGADEQVCAAIAYHRSSRLV